MSVADFKPNFWLRFLANGYYGLEFVGFVDITGGMEGARVLFGCFALSADPVAETLLVGNRLEGFEPKAGLGRGVEIGVGLVSAVAFGVIADFGFSAFFIPRVATALGFTFLDALPAHSCHFRPIAAAHDAVCRCIAASPDRPSAHYAAFSRSE